VPDADTRHSASRSSGNGVGVRRTRGVFPVVCQKFGRAFYGCALIETEQAAEPLLTLDEPDPSSGLRRDGEHSRDPGTAVLR
jgi:hypothetical protein